MTRPPEKRPPADRHQRSRPAGSPFAKDKKRRMDAPHRARAGKGETRAVYSPGAPAHQGRHARHDEPSSRRPKRIGRDGTPRHHAQGLERDGPPLHRAKRTAHDEPPRHLMKRADAHDTPAPRRAAYNKRPVSGGHHHNGPARHHESAQAHHERMRTRHEVMLYGLHAVSAALTNPARQCHRLFITGNAQPRLERLIADTYRADTGQTSRDRFSVHTPPTDVMEPPRIDRIVGMNGAGLDAVHQGVALRVSPLARPAPDMRQTLPLLLALDHVTDPRNLGAILRSAAAFGASAIICPPRHCPPESGALAKAASGALELVPIFQTPNLARFITHLASHHGYRTVALDAAGRTPLEQLDVQFPLLLALGAEGRGLRPGVRAACTECVRLRLAPAMPHLNVSSMAAIALHAVSRLPGTPVLPV